jgi:hypothetical protein
MLQVVRLRVLFTQSLLPYRTQYSSQEQDQLHGTNEQILGLPLDAIPSPKCGSAGDELEVEMGSQAEEQEPCFSEGEEWSER